MVQNRRDFIKTLGVVYGSLLLIPSCSSFPGTHYRIFTREEADCLIAICEQIIPADFDPGATDADVIGFIDKQTHLRFPNDLKIYQQGIISLQAFCQSEYGKLFEKLNNTIQVEILKKMERNKLPEEYWLKSEQSAFFQLILRRTMQGFYGSPRHGGNKNYVSYRMMKLDYPLLIGQNRYRDGK